MKPYPLRKACLIALVVLLLPAFAIAAAQGSDSPSSLPISVAPPISAAPLTSVADSASCPGNLISDGNFSNNVNGWSFYTDGQASFARPSGVGQVVVTAAGSNTQLYQANVPLIAGEPYILEFSAKSNTGRDMAVYLHKHTAPYNTYGLGSVTPNLTGDWIPYTYSFTATGFSGTVSDGRLRFMFSGFAKAGDVYQIDNVCLYRAPSGGMDNNDSFETATPVHLHLAPRCRPYGWYDDPAINPPGDVDFYAFTGHAGDRVRLRVVQLVDPVSSNLNGVLTLYGPDKAELTSSVPPDNYNGEIIATLPVDGVYYVRVSDAGHPNTGGPDYTYNTWCFEWEDRYEPNDDAANATPINFDEPILGIVDVLYDIDVYRFEASSAGEITASLGAYGDAFAGEDLHCAELALLDSSFSQLVSDQSYGSPVDPPQVTYALPAAGIYYLTVKSSDCVHDIQDLVGGYRLTLAQTDDDEFCPGNLLTNNDFANGTGNWVYFTNGGSAFTVNDGAGQVVFGVTGAGSSSQLYQSNVALTNGNNYVLNFKAKSNSGHDLAVYLHKHTSPFTDYGPNRAIADLTPDWELYSFPFTAGGFNGSVADGRLRFWFPGFAVASDVYTIDDVCLRQVP